MSTSTDLLRGNQGARPSQPDERRNYARNDHAPGFARMYARVRLGEWHLLHMAGPVQQVVSELVTNSVRHSAGENVMLWLIRTDTSIVVHVWDASAMAPFRRDAAADDEDGRGLAIVEAFSVRVGTYPHAGGKVTWAEIMR